MRPITANAKLTFNKDLTDLSLPRSQVDCAMDEIEILTSRQQVQYEEAETCNQISKVPKDLKGIWFTIANVPVEFEKKKIKICYLCACFL